MNQIKLPSPAKINRFLHITGRRADGYHNLQTIFQFIDYADQLTYTLTRTPGIRLESNCRTLKLERDENNLIYRAAKLLEKKNNSDFPGIHIYLEKNIPIGGGLGGGSSNAATTLLALNQLWKTHLSKQQLLGLGAQLGADVPVFIHGKTVWAEGIGDQFTAIDIDNPYFLVLKPQCHVNTKEIFLNPRLTRATQTTTIADFLQHGGNNDCQNVVRKLYAQVDNALICLEQYAKAQLTGTGACVFACFDKYHQAQQTLHQIPADYTAFVAQGLSQSPLHDALANLELHTL